MKKNYSHKSAEEKRAEINQLMSNIQDGVSNFLTSEKYANFLKTMAKFHNYSVNNIILITMQNPSATMVASYAAWKKNFNRNVKSGEHGIKILVPCFRKKEETDEEDEGENNAEKVIAGFTIGHVFDVSQTAQIADKEQVELSIVDNLNGQVTDYNKYLNAIISCAPVPVSFKDFGSDAHGYFDPAHQEIVVKPDLSQAQTLKTLLHECAHAIMHNPESKFREQYEMPEVSREDKEIEAESVAYVVTSYLGIEDTADYSFPYVASWSDHPKDVSKHFHAIRLASDQMITNLENALQA